MRRCTTGVHGRTGGLRLEALEQGADDLPHLLAALVDVAVGPPDDLEVGTQLEAGNYASPFEFRALTDETAAAQAFYQVWADNKAATFTLPMVCTETASATTAAGTAFLLALGPIMARTPPLTNFCDTAAADSALSSLSSTRSFTCTVLSARAIPP